MKALTLWQPWATLVAIGKKKIETRCWKTAYRGPLAIHAAKKPLYKTADMHPTLFTDWEGLPITDWPLGCVIAITELFDVKEVTVENIRCISMLEYTLGNFNTEHEPRYMWILRNPKQITPVPAKGFQRIWEWDEEGYDRRCLKCGAKPRKREYYVEKVGPYCLSCAKFIRHLKGITGNMEVRSI